MPHTTASEVLSPVLGTLPLTDFWDDPRSLTTFQTFRRSNGSGNSSFLAETTFGTPQHGTKSNSTNQKTPAYSSNPAGANQKTPESPSSPGSPRPISNNHPRVENGLQARQVLDGEAASGINEGNLKPKGKVLNHLKPVAPPRTFGTPGSAVKRSLPVTPFSASLGGHVDSANGKSKEATEAAVNGNGNYQHQDSNGGSWTGEVSITMGPSDKRFGFSVVGGGDEGFEPRIEHITPGSPADKADLEVGDEILEVNGRSLDNCTHTEVISHIHQCIRSRTICLRVKRKTSSKLALDLAQNNSVQDAFVIAVEQQARERLERLSALKKIKPVDMTKLSQELNECSNSNPELNGVIENNPIYVTTVPEIHSATLERVKDKLNNHVTDPNAPASNRPHYGQNLPGVNGHSQAHVDYDTHDQELELKQEIEEEDDIFQPPSPRTPPHERLLIESQEERDSGTRFSQECVSVETLLPNLNDKYRQLPNGNHTQQTTFNHRASQQSKGLRNSAKANGRIEPESRTHREMAVDVPDSFVAVAKTAPRYPPHKLYEPGFAERVQDFYMNSASEIAESDSKLNTVVSRSRGSSKSNYSSKDYLPKQSVDIYELQDRNVDSLETATEDQLERIKKYQEDIRKRKIAEERQAQENEFLRNSLRGSKKLQALESNPPQAPKHGLVNTAYLEDDSGFLTTRQRDSGHFVGRTEATKLPTPELAKSFGASELLQSLYRLSASLQGNGHSDADLMLVESLIRNADFQNILAIHNKVQEVCCFRCPPTPLTKEAQEIAQEVISLLQDSQSPDSVELLDILSKYEMEGVIYAHDKVSERQAVPTITPDEELLDRASQYTEESVKIVRIDKTNEPLGATVRNEGEAVVIGRVVKGGAAEKSGLLHEGDEILEVNGVEMRGKSVNDVCDVLATMNGTLTFLIIPTQQERKRPQREVVMHLKAHFDYDPDDDLYCPCRELGISFQKGDILHIINQDDPNWWQAYREGEEDQPLAGLVPSKTFQEQRESMKQAIIGETASREKEKKGTFLCAYMQHRKKKKKLYNANEDVEDQILTYEEVALYYPRANRKRPTVLIGPPNIGRHELRQRLMEDTERFAAAVPHTSRTKRDGEVDGSDYHFITRAQFESDIAAGRFVEHGEYEKNYYGTSLDAIRAVISAGKICVLNLHPQSLKILKTSDLLPYVVFVAPPSLEKLRMNRIKAGDNPKDDELKDIIEKAREMEENYGHYFDMVIVNSDIDKAFNELLKEINTLEREPQWVPAIWLKNNSS